MSHDLYTTKSEWHAYEIIQFSYYFFFYECETHVLNDRNELDDIEEEILEFGNFSFLFKRKMIEHKVFNYINHGKNILERDFFKIDSTSFFFVKLF
jgi:hypothetical protein